MNRSQRIRKQKRTDAIIRATIRAVIVASFVIVLVYLIGVNLDQPYS